MSPSPTSGTPRPHRHVPTHSRRNPRPETPPPPSLDISLRGHLADTFRNIGRELGQIAQLPFSVPAGVHSTATGPASPHCLENTGRSVWNYAQHVTESRTALIDFLRSVGHQVVDSGTHDIVLHAGLKPGGYANGLEIPSGDNPHESVAAYTMRLGIHNGRLRGRITFTPYMIQHGPKDPIFGVGLPHFLTARITSIEISQDTSGRIVFKGNALGVPVPLDITDQVTPMLFGTEEPVLVTPPSALTERILAYYTADPRRAQGINMVDPNTISLSLDSNAGAATAENISTLPRLQLGPLSLTGLNLTARFEAVPSAHGFLLRIPRTGFRELRIHTDERCGNVATPDTTLTNAGVSDLVLDIRHRPPSEGSDFPVYLHSFLARVSSGQLNMNGDVTAQATNDAPITLNADGTPEGRFTLTVTTPQQTINANVNAFGQSVQTANIRPGAATYTLTIPNIFDPLHTVARLTSDQTSLGLENATVGDQNVFQGVLRGFNSDTRQLELTASLGGFNPLDLMALNFRRLSAERLFAALGDHDPFVDIAIGSVSSALASLNAFMGTEGTGSLTPTSATVLHDMHFRLSGQNGLHASLNAALPPHTLTAHYAGTEDHRRRELDLGTTTNAPIGIRADVDVSRTGQVAVNRFSINGLDSTTDFSASTAFTDWIQRKLSPEAARFTDALSRRILPSPSTLAMFGVTLPNRIAFHSTLRTTGDGISVSTDDHGRSHRVTAELTANTRQPRTDRPTRFASSARIGARLTVLDTERHADLAPPRLTIAAGNNGLTVAHSLDARTPIGPFHMSGRLALNDQADGTIRATDHPLLEVPSLRLRNTATTNLAMRMPVEGGGYTGLPSTIDITGRLDADGGTSQRAVADGVTLASGLTAHTEFRLSIPRDRPERLTFHSNGSSDFRVDAGISAGAGNGIVRLTIRDQANFDASVASPPQANVADRLSVGIATEGEISGMTPLGHARLGGNVRIPVSTNGGGVSVSVQSVDAVARALSAWGVGASRTPSAGRRQPPHGSR